MALNILLHADTLELPLPNVSRPVTNVTVVDHKRHQECRINHMKNHQQIVHSNSVSVSSCTSAVANGFVLTNWEVAVAL